MTATHATAPTARDLILCCHYYTGTYSWPAPAEWRRNPRGPSASVYTCPRQQCLEASERFVYGRTGHHGKYRPFPPEATG